MILGAVACAEDGVDDGVGAGGSAPDPCPIGAEGCPCTSRGSCHQGLSCRSELCVDLGGGGSGGSGGGGSTEGRVGAACTADAECTEGVDPGCVTSDRGFPGGMCLSWCDPASGGAAACGADEGCITLGDNPDDSFCFPSCGSSRDCRSGYYCQRVDDLAVCFPGDCASTCPSGEACFGTVCDRRCDTTADCYEVFGYCGEDSRCHSVDEFATCTNAQFGPRRDASGPLLWGPTQADLDAGAPRCMKDPAACTNAGNVCAWDIQFYDPDGDVPQTKGRLYGKTRFLKEDGNPISAFNVDAPVGDTFTFYGCWDEARTDVRGGAMIADSAGHNSNAICFEGIAP